MYVCIVFSLKSLHLLLCICLTQEKTELTVGIDSCYSGVQSSPVYI